MKNSLTALAATCLVLPLACATPALASSAVPAPATAATSHVPSRPARPGAVPSPRCPPAMTDAARQRGMSTV